MLLFPGHVLSVAYGRAYLEAAGVIRILGAVLILRFFGSVYGVLLTVSGRQTLRAVATLLTLVGLCVADLLVIPHFGILGASYVLLAAHIVLSVTYVLFTRIEHGTTFLIPQYGRASRPQARRNGE
jgi:O-antigen/teichoic acid export membrane protein